MTNKNREEDRWGQMLSDFGIEDQIPVEEEPSAEGSGNPARVGTRTSGLDESGVSNRLPTASSEEQTESGRLEGTDSKTEAAEESSRTKERKTILSRFPKINSFFGVPPQVSLDSVMEGAKSPSLGGKTFTDNKMEKMPFSQDRQDRNVVKRPDALSEVASQIDVLASRSETKTRSEERSAKRHVSSMFEDPVHESEEARALKNLMEEQSHSDKKRRFLEEEKDSQRRGQRQYPTEEGEGRGRRQRQYSTDEARGRGSRSRLPVEEDDFSETDFESVDDKPVDDNRTTSRERGRRSSRYAETGPRTPEHVRGDTPQEEWSEIDAALQAKNEQPRYRSQRQERVRHDKRRKPDWTEMPAAEREDSEVEDGGVVSAHGDVPSWEEAISGILSGNITRHSGASGHSGSSRKSSASGRGDSAKRGRR